MYRGSVSRRYLLLSDVNLGQVKKKLYALSKLPNKHEGLSSVSAAYLGSFKQKRHNVLRIR